MKTALCLQGIALLLALLVREGEGQAVLTVWNKDMLDDPTKFTMYSNGEMNHVYDDSIYNSGANCRNGDLLIINNSKGGTLTLLHANFPPFSPSNAYIQRSPNAEPAPSLAYNATAINITFNCPLPDAIDDHNYFNKVQLYLPGIDHVSFLLNCDPGSRHKPFQFGYLILTIINAVIIVGVAMRSHIWSITWKGLPLSLELKWIPFAFFNVVSVVLFIGLYVFAVNNFSNAFLTLRYFGVFVAAFFVFICFNECFYLVKHLKAQAYKWLRWCDVASLSCTIVLTTLSAIFQDWILYDIMASCICVGCIKLFYFNNLRQAFISMGIYVFNVTSIAVALHYLLTERSYNDYATELSSPLFLEVPDLIDSLFKKCSWLVVVDVIVPGVMLSYLRMYDQNRSSSYGGVYTVWGNITFVLSTALWIGLEAVYPFSIPFCLVTYFSLCLTVFVIAVRRNDWKTLFQGTFQKSRSTLKDELMQYRSERFSALMKDALDPLKQSAGSESNPDNSRQSMN